MSASIIVVRKNPYYLSLTRHLDIGGMLLIRPPYCLSLGIV